jgi:hypothetical protein
VHGDAFGSEFVKDRKVTDLLTPFANDPRLGDEFHPRNNRVLVNNFKKKRRTRLPRLAAGQRGCEIEAESANNIFKADQCFTQQPRPRFGV